MSLNAKKALELISEVPAEKFISGAFTNDKDCCCVQGHLCRLTSYNPNDYSSENCNEWNETHSNQEEVSKFRAQTQKFIRAVYGLSNDIADVNNQSNINGYTQDDIKDRVVAFLNDMAAWEEKQETIQE